MSNLYPRALWLMIVSVLVIGMPVTAQTMEVTSGLLHDAERYAADVGVDLEEAIIRLQLQDGIGDLNGQLAMQEWETFGGLWIEHQPAFRVLVRFTRDGEKTMSSYVADTPLADLVEVRPAEATLAELEGVQFQAVSGLHELGIAVESQINVFQNRVEVFVADRGALDRTLLKAKVKLPSKVRLVTVDRLSEPVTDIYGGLALTTCTSGFSVKNSGGTKGVLTAAHCSNTQAYSGTNLPFQGSAKCGSYDVQWHTAPGFTVRNLAFDGTWNRYVYGTKSRSSQSAGQYVCKYGKTTGGGCGWISTTSYQRGSADCGWWSSNWIRVHRDGVDLSEGGDSGGPWFSGNTAYGIMAAQLGDDAIYMAINYISILNVSVLTN